MAAVDQLTHIDARAQRPVRIVEYLPDSLCMRVEDEHGYTALRSLHELMLMGDRALDQFVTEVAEVDREGLAGAVALGSNPSVGSVVRTRIGDDDVAARVVSKAHGMLYFRLINGEVHSRPPRDVTVIEATLPGFVSVTEPSEWIGQAVRIRQRCGKCVAYDAATEAIRIKWYADEGPEDRSCSKDHIDHVGSVIFLRNRGEGWKRRKR